VATAGLGKNDVPALDEAEFEAMDVSKGGTIKVMRVMQQPQTRRAPPNPALVGLLLVLAFLGHDVLMAAPASGAGPSGAVRSGLPETNAPTAVAAHPHDCGVGQTMAPRAPDYQPGHSLITIIVGRPALAALAFVPIRGVTRTQSHAPPHAVLQVFRI
jgi:hypothetical protein